MPNAREVGASVAPGTGVAVPVPVSETDCGEPEALSLTLNVPGREPVVVGVNVTEIVQLDPPVSGVPQVVVAE